MRISINQPYWMPYAGFHRLFLASDLFVILDDVQFSKGSWVNRNIINGKWHTLSIKRPHLGTLIKDLEWQKNTDYLLRPCAHIIETMKQTCEQLNIPFNTVRSSDLNTPNGLKGQDRVLAICEHLGATEYINAPGGKDLYDVKEFDKRGIELKFLSDYKNKKSVLERIANEGADNVSKDIHESIS